MGTPIVFDAATDARLDAERPWRTMSELAAGSMRGQNRSSIYELLKTDECGLHSTRRYEQALNPETGLPFGRPRHVYAEWRFQKAMGWHPDDTEMIRRLAQLGRCGSGQVREAIKEGHLRATLAPRTREVLFLSEPEVLRWTAIRRSKRRAT